LRTYSVKSTESGAYGDPKGTADVPNSSRISESRHTRVGSVCSRCLAGRMVRPATRATN
jgi:hypothetical protein